MGEKAARAQKGMETEFLQESPVRTTSNNSFPLDRGLEIYQTDFGIHHFPESASLEAWKLGLQDAGTHQAEMPTEQDASSGSFSWDER